MKPWVWEVHIQTPAHVFIHLVSVSSVQTYKEGSGGGARALSILGNLLICAFEANSTSLTPCQGYKNKHIKCYREFRKGSIYIHGQRERKMIHIHLKNEH